VRRHLLVTNDYPPKVGGIQNYLWELWRRLPPESFDVYTTPHKGADDFDARQLYRVDRSPEPVLLPNPILVRRINRIIAERAIDLVILDPAVPVGLIGPHLDAPYGVVLHGAEVTVPGRLPGTRQALNRVLRGAKLVIAAGEYPAAEAQRSVGGPLPIVIVPPGVDTEVYRPVEPEDRRTIRQRLSLPTDQPLVTSVSRLVPRKGMDTLIRAAVELRKDVPEVHVAIAGQGRDTKRLQRLIDETGAPVRLLGRLSEADKIGLLAASDVFAMMCRVRWGGLEQEGFGIVFLEAAACGVAQVAGASGGAAEAVEHEETGLVVDPPDDVAATAAALERLLHDSELRERMGLAARVRATDGFSYDLLAARLQSALDDVVL
jgi:phosphatidylinositol alpha-1,6-mannosyltransferase